MLQIEVLNRLSPAMPILLWEALHVPNIGATVISIGCIAKAGYTVFSMVALARFKTRTQRLLGKFL